MNEKINWPHTLKTGDTIGVFSPSEPLWDGRLEQVFLGCRRLEKYGYSVILSSNVDKEQWDSAGSIDDRLTDFNELLTNKGVQAIGSSWGGKAANQLVGSLNYDKIIQEKKPIFGFSDVAVLLNNITLRTGLITYFGPNVVGKLHETDHDDLHLLCDPNHGEGSNPFIARSLTEEWRAIRTQGSYEGTLFGGNLSTFVLGVELDLLKQHRGNIILFWESSSETPQIIKQYLNCLLLNGALNSVSCMIVGDVRWTDDGYEHEPIEDFLSDFASRAGIGLIMCPTFGHAKLTNPIIPVGATFHVESSPTNSRIIIG